MMGFRLPCLLVVLLIVTGQSLALGGRPDPKRWQATIEGMVKNEQLAAARGRICFVGSSSIRFWDLERWFPGQATLNRGFGGSQIADSTFYADELVIRHRPEVVVFYAGDNDIAAGLTPEEVAKDYAAFVARIRSDLPKVRVLFIAIKPSLARWDKYPRMAEANARIEALIETDPLAEFVDIATPMLGQDGEPRREFFVADGLHLNEEGYRLWSGLVADQLPVTVTADR